MHLLDVDAQLVDVVLQDQLLQEEERPLMAGVLPNLQHDRNLQLLDISPCSACGKQHDLHESMGHATALRRQTSLHELHKQTLFCFMHFAYNGDTDCLYNSFKLDAPARRPSRR